MFGYKALSCESSLTVELENRTLWEFSLVSLGRTALRKPMITENIPYEKNEFLLGEGSFVRILKSGSCKCTK